MKIGIIGLGLIGGTIAKSLKNKHYISAYDLSENTLKFAKENDIINEAYNDIENFISDNEVFYICLYPKAIIDFISKYKNLFKKNSIIIEISGVKTYMVQEISKLNLENIEVVFTHPVAGSEKVGVFHSKAEIFKNANYVITPVKNNKKSSLDLVKSLAKEMRFKNISCVTPEVHDSMIAYTSQLTHVLSLSLVNSVYAISTELETNRFIGDSYRDLTRISKINEKLWPDLFITNKQELLKKIELFEIELRKFKDALIMNDVKKLENLMINSTSLRENMDRGNKNDS
ncbi:MAG: prephenate dehydrogenase [Tenericutes bacterium]|nr:prephenate dehydrogenase [Mycoplasmatota bacterium]